MDFSTAGSATRRSRTLCLSVAGALAAAVMLGMLAFPSAALADELEGQADVLSEGAQEAQLEGESAPQTASFVDSDGEAVVIGSDYRIVSASDESLILDGESVTPTSGSNVSVWESNGGSNQLFNFAEGEDGSYLIQSSAANLVLDAAKASPKSGSNVSLWNANGGRNQMWVVVAEGVSATGVQLYSIHPLANASLVLDAAGSVPESGANVSVWKANGGTNQRWYFVKASSLAYATIAVSEAVRNETGTDLTAQVSVELNGEALQEGVDYTVSYDGQSAVSAVGSYGITVTGASSKCTGTAEAGTMSIIAKPEIDLNAMYKMSPQANSQLVVDAQNGLPTSGSNASVWTENGGSNQAITFSFDETRGFFTIHSVAVPNLVMDAARSNPKSGANVSFWKGNGGLNQCWVIEELSAGVYRFVNAANPSLVMDAAGAFPQTGSNISAWESNGGSNQHWTIRAVEATDISGKQVVAGDCQYTGWSVSPSYVTIDGITLSQGSDYTAEYTGNVYLGQVQMQITGRGLYSGVTSGTYWIYLADGVYYIKDAASKSASIDIDSASTSAGTRALLWTSHTNSNQGFTVKYLGNGEYSITNYNSKMVLDVCDGSQVAGTKVLQWTWTGAQNQKWMFEQDANGTKIKSALGDWYLSAGSTTAKSGSTLRIYQESAALRFAFVTVPSSTIQDWDRPPMSELQLDMWNRAQSYGSSTDWLIMADCQNCYLGVFYWDGDSWEYEHYWQSSPGAWSTPSPAGVYTVGSRGYSFGSGFTCYYWTQYWGDYLIHSPVYYQNTFELMEGVMGEHASHGCIRVLIENAKWIYDTIPGGTTVVVYY